MYFIFGMIQRMAHLSLLERWKDKHVIKVVTGIWRCGKSTLLQLFRDKLVSDGVPSACIIAMNLEDLDNEPYLDYKALYDYVKARLQAGRMNYLFFDEIQMVDQFQRVIDSLFLLENVDIYVTGSNASLLSGELATLLTGRYVEIRMYPLSFKEFASAFPETMSAETLYRHYVAYGAFPYVLQLREDAALIRDYLSGLYHTVVLKDVVARRKIADVTMLESVVRFLSDNIGNLTVIKRIADAMTSAGRKISGHTVEGYLSALTDSYIFYQVPRYDVKGKQYLKTGSKYYLADMGLRRLILGSKPGDGGHILENIIYLELLRRGGEVYVGKSDVAEIDFVVIEGDAKVYYQVALTVRDEATMQRELAPLQNLSDSYPKYLLTLDNDPPMSYDGIRQLYALDWLLQR